VSNNCCKSSSSLRHDIGRGGYETFRHFASYLGQSVATSVLGGGPRQNFAGRTRKSLMLVCIDPKSQQLYGKLVKRYHDDTKVDSSACAVCLVALRAVLAAMVPDFWQKK